MHDDDGLVPNHKTKVKVRHFDQPVSIRDLLHSTLDRLLNELLINQQPQGVVSVTCLDPEGEFAGRTVLLALDLDTQEEDYEGLFSGPDDPPNPEYRGSDE